MTQCFLRIRESGVRPVPRSPRYKSNWIEENSHRLAARSCYSQAGRSCLGWWIRLGGLLVISVFTGCQQESGSSSTPANGDGAATTGSAHDHEGPHGGDVVDLGHGQYHAEIVEDRDPARLFVYILDDSAKKSVAIGAGEVLLTATHGGHTDQFKLATSPAEDDPEGKSSRFVSTDPALLKHFSEEDFDGRLTLVLDDTQYVGRFSHARGAAAKED